MFRPVQNPDDEEVEGRVRTRTRTKELVYLLHEANKPSREERETERVCLNCFLFCFFLSLLCRLVLR